MGLPGIFGEWWGHLAYGTMFPLCAGLLSELFIFPHTLCDTLDVVNVLCAPEPVCCPVTPHILPALFYAALVQGWTLSRLRCCWNHTFPLLTPS